MSRLEELIKELCPEVYDTAKMEGRITMPSLGKYIAQ